jgi:hypothetical protein
MVSKHDCAAFELFGSNQLVYQRALIAASSVAFLKPVLWSRSMLLYIVALHAAVCRCTACCCMSLHCMLLYVVALHAAALYAGTQYKAYPTVGYGIV